MARQRTDLLDVDKIMANLTTERIGGKVLIYDSTSSTNDVAAEYAKIKQNDGLVVFAEEQTAGRGRAGNKWLSGRADSILCSIFLVENKINAELLSLTFAVAVAETIGRPGRSQAKIKWPNDIILNGKKVAGILLESKMDNGDSAYIVGIGINCHQKKESFTNELQQIATSIDAESHSISDRNFLARRLLVSVGQWLKIAANSSEKVIDRWRKLSIQLGHRVLLVFNGSKFMGHCIGIDPEKGLILQLDTGGIRMFDAAHTTIAKQ
jgi:BirA family biotin operon repressor/biotin-[acetyl-CoA-carboxylase] ligase